jgi:hypothetical protein
VDIVPPVAMKSEVPPPKKVEVAPPVMVDSVPAVAMKNEVPPLPPTPKPLPPVAAPIAPTTSPLATVSAYAKEPTGTNTPGWQTKPSDPLTRATPAAPVKTVTPPNGGMWPSAHETRPVQVAYATTGVVLFDDDPLPEPPPVMKEDQLPLLKQKIMTVCGGKVKDVSFEKKGDSKVHVMVKCVSSSDEVYLVNTIHGLPEMGSNMILDLHSEK